MRDHGIRRLWIVRLSFMRLLLDRARRPGPGPRPQPRQQGDEKRRGREKRNPPSRRDAGLSSSRRGAVITGAVSESITASAAVMRSSSGSAGARSGSASGSAGAVRGSGSRCGTGEAASGNAKSSGALVRCLWFGCKLVERAVNANLAAPGGNYVAYDRPRFVTGKWRQRRQELIQRLICRLIVREGARENQPECRGRRRVPVGAEPAAPQEAERHGVSRCRASGCPGFRRHHRC